MNYKFGNQRKRSRYHKALRDRFQLRIEESIDTEGDATPPKEDLKETPEPEDTTGLKTALADYKAKAKAAKAALAAKDAALSAKEEEFKQFAEKFNPEEYQALLADRERNNKAQADRDVAAEKLKQEQQAFLSKHQLEIEARDRSIADSLAKYASLEKTTALKEAFFAAQGNPKIADDGMSHFKLFANLQGDRFIVGENGALGVVGSDGNPLDSVINKGQSMGADEYIRSLHQHAILGSCFIADVPSGMGGNHGYNKVADNPKSASQMTSAERQAAVAASRSAV